MPQNIPQGYDTFNYETMGGGQKQLYDYLQSMMMNQGGKGMQNLFGMAGGDQDLYSQLEAPAMRQFQQQIAPGIANRYTGSGLKGSSGFENSLANAGSNLAENLQSQRMGYQQHAMDRVMELMERLTGMSTNQAGLVQKPQTDWAGMFSSLANTGLSMIPGLSQASAISKLAASIGGTK